MMTAATTLRLASALALVVAGAAAFSSQHQPAASTPTSPSAPSSSSPTSNANSNGSSSTLPESSLVVPIDGTGNRVVDLPHGSAAAIVHAEHHGKGSFSVHSVDSNGHDVDLLAAALGDYDGTFAANFVSTRSVTVKRIRVAAIDAWHLDIGDPTLAATFTSQRGGKGDTVLAYEGKRGRATVSLTSGSTMVLRTYSSIGLSLLTRLDAPGSTVVNLPDGPFFVAVTCDGDWSITVTPR